MPDRFKIESVQDIGARPEQQDRVFMSRKNDTCLIALADGMGGHMRGAFAAQMVVGAAETALEAAPKDTSVDSLFGAIVQFACSKLDEEWKIVDGPATTCVLLHLTPDTASWAHFGDSRIYRFDNGRFLARSVDQNHMELARFRGVPEEEIQADPNKHVIINYFGHLNRPEINIKTASFSESNGFLLCSDGLSENISESDMEAAMQAEDLAVALTGLVAKARAAGGKRCDNISVVAARPNR